MNEIPGCDACQQYLVDLPHTCTAWRSGSQPGNVSSFSGHDMQILESQDLDRHQWDHEVYPSVFGHTKDSNHQPNYQNHFQAHEDLHEGQSFVNSATDTIKGKGLLLPSSPLYTQHWDHVYSARPDYGSTQTHQPTSLDTPPQLCSNQFPSCAAASTPTSDAPPHPTWPYRPAQGSPASTSPNPQSLKSFSPTHLVHPSRSQIHNAQPNWNQNIQPPITAVVPLTDISTEPELIPSSQEATTLSWIGCRACSVSHQACRPGNNISHPYRCEACITKKRKGYCRGPVPELAAQDSLSLIELARAFDAHDMEAKIFPPYPQFPTVQLEIGSDATHLVKLSLQRLRDFTISPEPENPLDSCIAEVLGLPSKVDDTSMTTHDAVVEHCNAFSDSLKLLCHPDTCTVTTTTPLQPVIRPLVLLMCHQVYLHANHHLRLFYAKVAEFIAVPPAPGNKEDANDIAYRLGKVHGLMSGLESKLHAWQRVELSRLILFPHLPTTLKSLECMGYGLSKKGFERGRAADINRLSQTNIIIRQAIHGPSLRNGSLFGVAQEHLSLEDIGIDIYFPKDLEDSKWASISLQQHRHTIEGLAPDIPIDIQEEEHIINIVERLQHYLACRQKHRGQMDSQSDRNNIPRVGTIKVTSRDRYHQSGQDTPPSNKFSFDTPTIGASDNDGGIEDSLQALSPIQSTTEVSTAETTPVSSTTIALMLSNASQITAERIGKASNTSHKRKQSLQPQEAMQIAVESSQHPTLDPTSSSRPTSTLPYKKSIARKFWNKLTGPRLNPHEPTPNELSIPESPYDLHVQLNGRSHRPVSWPRSRRWRKSIGEATKDVSKPRPERDYAGEAQARSQKQWDQDADVQSQLKIFGFL